MDFLLSAVVVAVSGSLYLSRRDEPPPNSIQTWSEIERRITLPPLVEVVDTTALIKELGDTSQSRAVRLLSNRAVKHLGGFNQVLVVLSRAIPKEASSAEVAAGASLLQCLLHADLVLSLEDESRLFAVIVQLGASSDASLRSHAVSLGQKRIAPYVESGRPLFVTVQLVRNFFRATIQAQNTNVAFFDTTVAMIDQLTSVAPSEVSLELLDCLDYMVSVSMCSEALVSTRSTAVKLLCCWSALSYTKKIFFERFRGRVDELAAVAAEALCTVTNSDHPLWLLSKLVSDTDHDFILSEMRNGKSLRRLVQALVLHLTTPNAFIALQPLAYLTNFGPPYFDLYLFTDTYDPMARRYYEMLMSAGILRYFPSKHHFNGVLNANNVVRFLNEYSAATQRLARIFTRSGHSRRFIYIASEADVDELIVQLAPRLMTVDQPLESSDLALTFQALIRLGSDSVLISTFVLGNNQGLFDKLMQPSKCLFPILTELTFRGLCDPSRLLQFAASVFRATDENTPFYLAFAAAAMHPFRFGYAFVNAVLETDPSQVAWVLWSFMQHYLDVCENENGSACDVRYALRAIIILQRVAVTALMNIPPSVAAPLIARLVDWVRRGRAPCSLINHIILSFTSYTELVGLLDLEILKEIPRVPLSDLAVNEIWQSAAAIRVVNSAIRQETTVYPNVTIKMVPSGVFAPFAFRLRKGRGVAVSGLHLLSSVPDVCVRSSVALKARTKSYFEVHLDSPWVGGYGSAVVGFVSSKANFFGMLRGFIGCDRGGGESFGMSFGPDLPIVRQSRVIIEPVLRGRPFIAASELVGKVVGVEVTLRDASEELPSTVAFYLNGEKLDDELVLPRDSPTEEPREWFPALSLGSSRLVSLVWSEEGFAYPIPNGALPFCVCQKASEQTLAERAAFERVLAHEKEEVIVQDVDPMYFFEFRLTHMAGASSEYRIGWTGATAESVANFEYHDRPREMSLFRLWHGDSAHVPLAVATARAKAETAAKQNAPAGGGLVSPPPTREGDSPTPPPPSPLSSCAELEPSLGGEGKPASDEASLPPTSSLMPLATLSSESGSSNTVEGAAASQSEPSLSRSPSSTSSVFSSSGSSSSSSSSSSRDGDAPPLTSSSLSSSLPSQQQAIVSSSSSSSSSSPTAASSGVPSGLDTFTPVLTGTELGCEVSVGDVVGVGITKDHLSMFLFKNGVFLDAIAVAGPISSLRPLFISYHVSDHMLGTFVEPFAYPPRGLRKGAPSSEPQA